MELHWSAAFSIFLNKDLQTLGLFVYFYSIYLITLWVQALCENAKNQPN